MCQFPKSLISFIYWKVWSMCSSDMLPLLYFKMKRFALKNNPVSPPLLSALPRFAGTLPILIQIVWLCYYIYLIIVVLKFLLFKYKIFKPDYSTDTLHQESPPTLSLEYFGDNGKVGFWINQKGEWQQPLCHSWTSGLQMSVSEEGGHKLCRDLCWGKALSHLSHCSSPPSATRYLLLEFPRGS